MLFIGHIHIKQHLFGLFAYFGFGGNAPDSIEGKGPITLGKTGDNYILNNA